jgi:hypothetical protein
VLALYSFFLFLYYYIWANFLNRQKWNIYLNIKKCTPLSTRCAKTSYNSLQEAQTKIQDKLVDTQTEQGVRPPTMKVKTQSNIRRPHPSIGKCLDFVQELLYRVCRISKDPEVPFIPNNPNTSKSYELQERPPRTEATSWISELNKMIREGVCIHRREPNPRPN